MSTSSGAEKIDWRLMRMLRKLHFYQWWTVRFCKYIDTDYYYLFNFILCFLSYYVSFYRCLLQNFPEGYSPYLYAHCSLYIILSPLPEQTGVDVQCTIIGFLQTAMAGQELCFLAWNGWRGSRAMTAVCYFCLSLSLQVFVQRWGKPSVVAGEQRKGGWRILFAACRRGRHSGGAAGMGTAAWPAAAGSLPFLWGRKFPISCRWGKLGGMDTPFLRSLATLMRWNSCIQTITLAECVKYALPGAGGRTYTYSTGLWRDARKRPGIRLLC